MNIMYAHIIHLYIYTFMKELRFSGCKLGPLLSYNMFTKGQADAEHSTSLKARMLTKTDK